MNETIVPLANGDFAVQADRPRRSPLTSHRFDLATQFCLGCGLSAQDLTDPPRAAREHLATAAARVADCPAIYADFPDGNDAKVSVIITPDERMIVERVDGDGRVLLSLGQRAMFELRDAIEFGARRIRDRAA